MHMGQMAFMVSERQRGHLPSTSEVNPRRDGKEHCKVITLRSGNMVETNIHEHKGNVVEEIKMMKLPCRMRKIMLKLWGTLEGIEKFSCEHSHEGARITH